MKALFVQHNYESNFRANIIDGVNIFANALDTVISENENVYDIRVLSKTLIETRYNGTKTAISFDSHGGANLPVYTHVYHVSSCKPTWMHACIHTDGTV